jgi:hypothetical protein
MSSALSSPFMSETIAEVVPDVAKVGGKLAMSSVITGRRRVRLVPQSGQTYGSGASSGIVNILIQDGQAYADLLSACVSFEVTVNDAGVANPAGTLPVSTNYCVLDDGAYSVFRRALISVNSTLMDDTDFLAKKVNGELYATASQAWYNNVGAWLGLWKANTDEYGYVPTQTAGGADEIQISKYNVPSKALQYARRLQSQNGAGTAPIYPGQNKFSVPLSLLTSFFRNDTLFPSRNAGQLYVQLNLASALEACIAGSAGPNPSYTITNLTLELDFVDLHPTYLSLMDDMIEAPSGSGVNWAFDSHLVTSQSIGSGSGSKSVIVSKASQNMRSLHVVAQPTAGLASAKFPSQSCFNNPNFIDIQYRVGSLYYPAFTAVGEARAFMDLQNAFGSPESSDKSGIIDTLNYYTTSAVAVGTAAPALTVNNSGTPTATSATVPLANAGWSDCWMYAYCFDRLKHAKFHGIDLDGINTLTSAGSQMVVQINCAPTVDTTLVSIVRFTRVLHLGGGATSVIG